MPATTGGVCIVSHAAVVGPPVGIASPGFTIEYYWVLQETRKDTIKLLCLLKVN